MSSDDDIDLPIDDIHSLVCAQPPSNATTMVAIAICLALVIIFLLRIRCQFPFSKRAFLRNFDAKMRA